MSVGITKEYPIASLDPIKTIDVKLLEEARAIQVEVRTAGCFEGNGFYLDRYTYDWQLVLDAPFGELILLPTKKEGI